MIKLAGQWLTYNVRSTKYIPIFLFLPFISMDGREPLLGLLESLHRDPCTGCVAFLPPCPKSSPEDL
jgi:hypothetical protein